MKTDEAIYFFISVSKRSFLSGVNGNAPLTAQKWPEESADARENREGKLSSFHFLITLTTENTGITARFTILCNTSLTTHCAHIGLRKSTVMFSVFVCTHCMCMYIVQAQVIVTAIIFVSQFR